MVSLTVRPQRECSIQLGPVRCYKIEMTARSRPRAPLLLGSPRPRVQQTPNASGADQLRLVLVLRSGAVSGTPQRALTTHPAAKARQVRVYRSSKAKPSDQMSTVGLGDVVKERASCGTM